MSFDDDLAGRVRRALDGTPGLSERRMFGGLAFLVRGNMCCGVTGSTLMVRVGPEAYADALTRPGVREMTFTGRPLRGMVYVDPPGRATPAALRTWVRRGAAHAASLPARDRPGGKK